MLEYEIQWDNGLGGHSVDEFNSLQEAIQYARDHAKKANKNQRIQVGLASLNEWEHEEFFEAK